MTSQILLALPLAIATAGPAAAAPGEDPHAGHAAHAALPGAAPLASESVYQLEGVWTAAPDRTISLAELRGKPVVLLLFYGTCNSVCPTLVRDLQRIEAQLAPGERDAARFVLVSFDPAADTPERLAAYAGEHGLAAPRWRLLHGRDDQVRELAAAVGVRYRRAAGGQYTHTQRITLLDRDGRVAAHWDGLERPLDGIVTRLREELASEGSR
jgi:protein SCO1/2